MPHLRVRPTFLGVNRRSTTTIGFTPSIWMNGSAEIFQQNMPGSTNFLHQARAAADAQDRYELQTNGNITRGPGGSTVPITAFYHGTGSPEGAVTAGPGSIWQREDGGTGTSFYVKETGTGNTGWVAK